MRLFQAPLTFNAEDDVEALQLVELVRRQLKNAGHKVHIGSVEDAIAASKDAVVVHTDGGCHNQKQGGLGAWAFTADFPDGTERLVASSALLGTTNNRMELMAVIKALEFLEIGQPIKIVCDSLYVIEGTTKWAPNWIRRGWKTIQNEPVLNRDLWERLVKLYELHQVTFVHVKGHIGYEGNDFVDELCTATMAKASAWLDKCPVDTGNVAPASA